MLQTFHHAKPHKGSPFKASSLLTRKRKITYDPRPSKFRGLSSYPCYFRNIVLNFQVSVQFIKNNLFTTYETIHDTLINYCLLVCFDRKDVKKFMFIDYLCFLITRLTTDPL